MSSHLRRYHELNRNVQTLALTQTSNKRRPSVMCPQRKWRRRSLTTPSPAKWPVSCMEAAQRLRPAHAWGALNLLGCHQKHWPVMGAPQMHRSGFSRTVTNSKEKKQESESYGSDWLHHSQLCGLSQGSPRLSSSSSSDDPQQWQCTTPGVHFLRHSCKNACALYMPAKLIFLHQKIWLQMVKA